MSTESISVETEMGLETAIRTRRSVRGYLEKPVPREVLETIFESAQRSPSNCNIQPWRVFVASGEKRNTIRARLVELASNGVPQNPDYDYPGKFDGEYRSRQVACAVAMYSAMGIGRGDTEGRKRASLRNFELFDAPHVAFICMNRAFGATVALDVGMYAQTLMLLMTAHGVSSCAQGCMRFYPDVVREEFGITDDLAVLFGISFGYEDPDVPVNAAITTREPLSANVLFAD